MSSEILISIYVLFAVLGLCIGSFLNVVIYRLPINMSLSRPSSHCTNCGYVLRWYDNIPVLSWLILKGRCRKCNQKISPRYILVEFFTGAIFLACALLFAKTSIFYAVISALACSVLICIFFIDLKHLIIFDRFHIILIALAIPAIFFDEFTFWYDHLIGFVAGGGIFLLIYFGCLWLIKREGIGFGDVKLAFAVGLLLGWQKFILAILIASLLACFVIIPYRLVKAQDRQKEYPFGPFIAVGVAVALLLGNLILNWYIGLFSF